VVRVDKKVDALMADCVTVINVAFSYVCLFVCLPVCMSIDVFVPLFTYFSVIFATRFCPLWKILNHIKLFLIKITLFFFSNLIKLLYAFCLLITFNSL